MRVFRQLFNPLSWISGTAAVLLILGTPKQAQAVQLVFDAVGTINAPIYWEKKNKQYPTGDFFTMAITTGQLVVTYDTVTGVTNFTGVTEGCIRNCNSPFDGTEGSRGQYLGSGNFEWDLTLINPLASLTEPDGSEFGYSMQNAGTITLLDPAGNVPTVSTVAAKNDKYFAWRAFEVADGIYHTEGWLQLMGGVVGGFSRFETGANNSAVNWDLALHLREGPPDPPTEVPEPLSAILLGTGLLGFGARKRLRQQG